MLGQKLSGYPYIIYPRLLLSLCMHAGYLVFCWWIDLLLHGKKLAAFPRSLPSNLVGFLGFQSWLGGLFALLPILPLYFIASALHL